MSGHTPFRELHHADPGHDSPPRRARRAAMKQAMRDAVTLAELRGQRGVTQEDLAEQLRMTQANVSRIEHESDVYLSTLEGYVRALGGQLRLVAAFPEQELTIALERDAG